jgi:hypothetical protein
MSDDSLFCEDCDAELSHNDIEHVSPVPQFNPESFEMTGETAEVYKCAGCGTILGFDLL